MNLDRFHYSVFAKSAWHEKGGVSITPFLFVFISFVRTHFETEDVVYIVVLAFSKGSVFGVSIENDAFSDVSVFKSLHFEQRFQMSPFSIVFNGNTNPKTETFHSVFIRKRSNGNGALVRSVGHSNPNPSSEVLMVTLNLIHETGRFD